MSRLNDHAWLEFKAAGWLDEDGRFKDDMQEAICQHVLKLLEIFAEEGHSGTTAPYAANMFKTLAMFEPIAPLTGEDWEWTEVGTGVFQNKRCSRVFKQADRFDGQAYDLEGKVFYEWHERELEPDESGYPGKTRYKSHYTSRDSMVPITFPYKPIHNYVERPSEAS
jgi:hypothetical protein